MYYINPGIFCLSLYFIIGIDAFTGTWGKSKIFSESIFSKSIFSIDLLV